MSSNPATIPPPNRRPASPAHRYGFVPRETECHRTILPPGALAPGFTLPCGPDGETASLRDYRGRPVVLAFYPADWSPVCGDQLVLYNECLDLFTEHARAQVIGISVDGPWSHHAYAQERKLRFPLLSDFEPKGEVARLYGVYRTDGVSERALFVIDGRGVIRWSHLSEYYTNPGADGILAALEQIAPSSPATGR